MKKVFIVLILVGVCAVVGSAQSLQTPKTAQKAMLLKDGTPIKDAKTGQVLRVAKGTVSLPATNGKVTITKSDAKQPNDSKKSSGTLPLKQLPKNITPLKKLGKQ